MDTTRLTPGHFGAGAPAILLLQFPTRPQIRDKALEIALTQQGVCERKGTPNSGPEIDEYLRAVNSPPGAHWCAAFVVWCYAQAAQQLGSIRHMPLRRTAGVSRLWHTAPMLWRSQQPTKGAIFCHLKNPKDLRSPGHCGLVVRLHVEEGWIETIEGNTNAQGSRVGDRVRVNQRELSYVNLGYLDVGREGPESPALLQS